MDTYYADLEALNNQKSYMVTRKRICADGTISLNTYIVKHKMKTDRKKPAVTEELRQKIQADIAYGCQKKIIADRYGISLYHLQKILTGKL